MKSKNLTPEQKKVLFEKGTERAFSGKYWNHKEKGHYACANCGSILFSSEAKFDSGTGWPSFFQPASEKSIETKRDFSLLIPRTEALCKKCKGHLGHVFPDGPKKRLLGKRGLSSHAGSGLRYCINSASLDFRKKKPAQ